MCPGARNGAVRERFGATRKTNAVHEKSAILDVSAMAPAFYPRLKYFRTAALSGRDVFGCSRVLNSSTLEPLERMS
jgi:hypothetical protein